MRNDTRQKLLTASQRKYLEARVQTHSRKISRFRYHVKEDKTAMAVVQQWEDEVERKTAEIDKAIDAEVTRVRDALMFDEPESAVAQVEDFERLTTEHFS